MKTQHTEGKWEITKPIRGYKSCIMSGGFAIADLPIQMTTIEDKANAKLIAAAPEMLKALIQAEDLIKYLIEDNEESDVLKDLQQAIKKATT